MSDLDIILEALDRARQEAALNDADQTPYILIREKLLEARKEAEELDDANDREAYEDAMGTQGQA
jgi:hypothetical protein